MLIKYSQIAIAITASALLLGSVSQSVQAQVSADTLRLANRGISDEAINYQTLYVDSTAGSDSADGVEAQPLRTVTRALEVAPPNTVIVLAPGRYTQGSGEVFPLQLKPGVTIQGTPGAGERTAIIEGGGDFTSPTRADQNAAILAADRAGIAQVAVSNPDGYGIWIESSSPTILESAFVGNRQTGIYVAGGSPRVQGSYFSGNEVAGLIVFGLSSANIQRNTFDGTGDAIRVLDGATPEIVGNRITNNDAGVVLIGDARPVLRDNQIMGNRQDDVVEVSARVRDVDASEVLAEGRNEPKPELADAELTDTVAEAADNFRETQQIATATEESFAESSVLPAGAPGAALQSLQSGVALAPRAVTGENPDSPRDILRNRRRRREEPRPAPAARPASPVNNNRLAVPNTSIPLGSGASATIFSPPNGGAGSPPAPPSRAQALGLYYRVFVPTGNPFEQDEVRRVIPDAFRTRFDGQTVMQVGAFPTEREAEERREILEDNGFDVRVEYIR